MRVIRLNGLKLCSKLFFNYFQNKNGIRIKIQVDDLFLSHPSVKSYPHIKQNPQNPQIFMDLQDS